MVAVDASTAGEFTINEVTRLFENRLLTTSIARRQNYDVSLDGQRFLMTEPVNAAGKPVAEEESTIRVITNWPAKFVPEQ